MSGRARWWVLGLLLLATIINFVDRQALSLVAPVLRDELALSNTQYGTIVSAFMLGMLVGELPMGWLMDRIGPRRGLALAVLSWSLANAAHAVARTAAQFAAFRFWLGTGECGNYSGGVKVVAQHFPPAQRAFAIGVFNGGSTLGSIIAPPLLLALTMSFGWRWAFLVPSALGLVWVAVWLGTYRSPPAPLEPEAGPPPSTSELLRRRQTWALMLCRALVGPVVQLYIFWMPEYLFRARGLGLREIAAFAWIPYVFGDAGSMAGGAVSGLLMKRGVSLARARAATLLAGAALCLCSAAVAAAPTASLAIAGICVVLFGHYFLSANMFAAVSDMFPASAAARVTALTGIAGGLSGMAFPALTGVLVDHVSYTPVLLLASAMPLAGALALVALSDRFRRVSL
jgi:ACS family hexuronate transporter-like MFS transporter